MYILGISCFYHDAAACILKDGVLIAASEEERFSRLKHDSRFPILAIDFCLKQAGIGYHDLDYVVFYEKPLKKLDRSLKTLLSVFPKGRKVVDHMLKHWLGQQLWIKQRIKKHCHISESQIFFVDHHYSHAASAFFCSPFQEAAIVTVDGVGEWTTATMGWGKADWIGNGKSEMHLDWEIRFPHSLGLLYSAFTAFLGFEVNEGEYKVMGMAPYGYPRFLDKIEKVVHVGEDGSFHLDLDYFEFHHSTQRMFSQKFVDLFGNSRAKSDDFFTYATHPKRDHIAWSEEGARQNQYYADIAASIQKKTEEILLKMAREAYRRTGLKKLCLAGGVALNSVANGRILNETPFEDLYIQPAAGDAGGALGASLYAYHVLLGQPRKFVMEHAYWGKSYSQQEIEDFLKKMGVRYQSLDSVESLTNHVVDAIHQGKVIGWFQGRFEWGPRALGNRSILADPRRPEMKEIVNEKIKFREPFRPFAPAILDSYTKEYFDFEEPKQHYPTRYMLEVHKFRDSKGDQVKAVNHMGTGRLQTVQQNTNPVYYELLKKFNEATGVPVLLNTSFNLRGEPIVTTPENAFNTFTKSGIDWLVLENCLVMKERLS